MPRRLEQYQANKNRNATAKHKNTQETINMEKDSRSTSNVQLMDSSHEGQIAFKNPRKCRPMIGIRPSRT